MPLANNQNETNWIEILSQAMISTIALLAFARKSFDGNHRIGNAAKGNLQE